MIDEVVSEAVGGLFRAVLWMVKDALWEILIQGTGYLICRPFNRDIDPDGFWIVLVGILFWAGVACAAYRFHVHWLSTALQGGPR